MPPGNSHKERGGQISTYHQKSLDRAIVHGRREREKTKNNKKPGLQEEKEEEEEEAQRERDSVGGERESWQRTRRMF